MKKGIFLSVTSIIFLLAMLHNAFPAPSFKISAGDAEYLKLFNSPNDPVKDTYIKTNKIKSITAQTTIYSPTGDVEKNFKSLAEEYTPFYKLSSSISYDQDEKIKMEWRYTYDEKQRLTESFYKFKALLSTTNKYSYGTDGKLIENTSFDEDNTLDGKITFTYDSAGRVLTLKEMGPNNASKLDCKYIYDEKNNSVIIESAYAGGKTVRPSVRYSPSGVMIENIVEYADGSKTRTVNILDSSENIIESAEYNQVNLLIEKTIFNYEKGSILKSKFNWSNIKEKVTLIKYEYDEKNLPLKEVHFSAPNPYGFMEQTNDERDKLVKEILNSLAAPKPSSIVKYSYVK